MLVLQNLAVARGLSIMNLLVHAVEYHMHSLVQHILKVQGELKSVTEKVLSLISVYYA